jgi:hypothetical protein
MAGYKAILPTVVRQYLSPRKASYVIRLSEGVQERKQGTDFFQLCYGQSHRLHPTRAQT